MPKKKNEWVVYPEVELTIDDYNEHHKMTEQKNEEVKPIDISGEIKTEEKINSADEVLDSEELSDEEKREIYIEQLKEARRTFKPIKQKGNITTNQFGTSYKQKRKRKNKLTKASRKANR